MSQFYEPQMKSIAERVNRKPRLVQCIQMLNEEEFAPLVLRSIYDQVDRILVIEGAVANNPRSTPDGHSIDKTREILADFKANHDPKKKVVVISINKHWKNLEEMKQTFLDMSIPGDWILINDADEIYRSADIVRLRKAIELHPHVQEWIPTFLHFYRDFSHIAKPGPEWNPFHQRIFKYVRGMKYVHHPTVYDPAGNDTYFSQQYWHRRYHLNDFFVFHYGYARSGMDDIMKAKQTYYEKELAVHGAANKKFDQKVKDWFANTEPVLYFDGEHPSVMDKQSVDVFTPRSPNENLWRDDTLYGKILRREQFGTMWLNQTGQAQPPVPFFHNEVSV